MIYSNAAFQLFIPASVLLLHQGRLVVPSAPLAFTAHLQSVYRDGLTPGKPLMASMRIGATPDTQMHALIRPFVLANQLEGPFVPRKCLMVPVIDPSRATLSNLQAFATVYGITPAEMEILQAFSEGYSPTEIAMALNSKQDRVKFHLKNIYRKTNVSKQTDLARLIAQF